MINFTASGGATPYMFSLQSGVLPEGFVLDSATGEIADTPVTLGDFPLTLQVTDAAAATDTRAVVISVRTTGTALATSAAVGSTAAILTVRYPGLEAGQTCDAIVRDATGAVVHSAGIATGPATRRVALSPLPAGTALGYEVACGLLTGSGSMTTSTVTGTASVSLSLFPPGSAGATQVRVEHGASLALGSTQTVPCPSGCQFALTGLQRGSVVYLRHSWLNASGAVVAQGAVRPVLVE